MIVRVFPYRSRYQVFDDSGILFSGIMPGVPLEEWLYNLGLETTGPHTPTIGTELGTSLDHPVTYHGRFVL